MTAENCGHIRVIGSVKLDFFDTGNDTFKPRPMTKHSSFRYFKTSPEVIRLAVMMYVRFPLSLRNVEDLLHKRSIDVSHETVQFSGTVPLLSLSGDNY